MKRITIFHVVLFLHSAICILQSYAQPGSLDLTFNPGTGANNAVYQTILQNDGKIIIIGSFTSYNGTPRNRIARLNADGTLDGSFNPGTGPNSNVSTMALQSDGKIIIAGVFTSYNGTTRNRIARLNANGTLDVSFDPGAGANNAIGTIAVQSNGKIIIGGFFTSYNGISRSKIARLNNDGTLDISFDPGTGTGGVGIVNTIALQSNGKIIIGGQFSIYNGTVRNSIARLNDDGTLDNSFNPGTGTPGTLFISALQIDGKIIIGGLFSIYDGTARNNIARLNSDGTLDHSFDPGTGTNFSVSAISLLSDGKIIIGGGFSSYNGTVRNRIARVNANGTLDISFNPGGANNSVSTTALQSDGNIIIGGDFTAYNGTIRNRIARVMGDGLIQWYQDADGDNWYGSSQLASSQPEGAGWSTLPENGSGDCDDASASIYPGATEVCGNGIDENCYGIADDVCPNAITLDNVPLGPFCPLAQASFDVPFTKTGTFNAGNVFTAQLSDASGSFATPIIIGTLTSTSSGTISAQLPVITNTGAGFRIRVVSSDPVVTSADNGTNISIEPSILSTRYTLDPRCPGDNIHVQFSVNCNFNSDNQFTAQLSDASGSFESPIDLPGWISSNDASVPINSSIPANTPPGTGYRIRVKGSDPEFYSSPGSPFIVPAILTGDIETVEGEGSPFCPFVTINIPFTFCNGANFNAGNVFTAQLSNPSGSFASGTTNIGTLSGTTAGTIQANLLPGIPASDDYKVRVISSHPSSGDANASIETSIEIQDDIDHDGDGFSACDGDCNDVLEEGGFPIHPGAEEICGNDVDENCDGSLIKDNCNSSFVVDVVTVNSSVPLGCPNGITFDGHFVFDNCYETWSAKSLNLAIIGYADIGLGTAAKDSVLHGSLPAFPNANWRILAYADDTPFSNEVYDPGTLGACGPKSFTITANNGFSPCDGVVSLVSTTPASSPTAADGTATFHLTTGACLNGSWEVFMKDQFTNQMISQGLEISYGNDITVQQLPKGTYVIASTMFGDKCPNTFNGTTVTIPCAPPVTGAITGPASEVCRNTTKTYTVASQPNTQYIWNNPANSNIQSGQNTNTCTIKYTSRFTSGVLICAATNICGTDPNPTRLDISSTPPPPPSISGPVTVCKRSTQTYTCPAVPGATSYNWTRPPGASFQSPNGTTSITIKFGNNGGDVSVASVNACGTGAYQPLAVTTTACTRLDSDIDEHAVINNVLTVYPNPASTYLKISFASGASKSTLEIYNMLGEKVLTKNLQAGEVGAFNEGLDISQLVNGIYLLRVVNEEGTAEQTFVKE